MNKQSHYETLGVKPDASPAEIKREYLNRAKSAHPDKPGGSDEKMSEINHAFDVLSDPSRRLLYDSIGKDSVPPEEERVRGLIMQAFLSALTGDAPNVVKGAQQFLETAQVNIKKQRADGQLALDSLKERREKVTTKSPVNAFHLIVDQQIIQIEQRLAGLDNDIEMCVKAAKELKKYKSSEKLVEVATYQQWGNLGSASTGSNW